MESLSRCLRLQVCSLALSGIKSHGGCGAYHLACLFACLTLTEVCSLILLTCVVYHEHRFVLVLLAEDDGIHSYRTYS
jgi:hypothetical protein